MNVLDFFVKKYSYLRDGYYAPNWAIAPIRLVFRSLAHKVLPLYLANHNSRKTKNTYDVIVSLTSFPARINSVWQVVECMFRQTLIPKKIILWLSEEQFPNKESIPGSLLEREGDIFEIRMVSGDVRSHKKYLYVSREYLNSKVILIDDDIYYPTDIIEKLVMTYEQNGGVVCNYGCIVKNDERGCLLPYCQWDDAYEYTESENFFFGSGGGIIFTPSDMYKDLTNIDLAMILTPMADDIWLNAMSRLASLRLTKLESGLILSIEQSGDNPTLAKQNVSFGGNDKQIMQVNDYYYNRIGKSVF